MFEIVKGDITSQKVDAIVNAANNTLLGGGGVDGAIHKAAGPNLLLECREIGGCPTGEARITKGYRLPAKYVVHVVGPVWQGGNHNEEILLASCYRNAMILSDQKRINSLAFPNISTGIYGFPKELAASIAIQEVQKNMKDMLHLKRVIFVTFDQENYEIYKNILMANSEQTD